MLAVHQQSTTSAAADGDGVRDEARPEDQLQRQGGALPIGRLPLHRQEQLQAKFHDAGDVYWRDDTVDGVKYDEKMRKNVFPEIRKIAKKSKAKLARAQDDNAKPHTKAWEKLGLTAAAKGTSAQVTIERQKQGARSPDCNVCDLYVWGVLQAGVNKRRPKTLDQLWEAIQASWKEDLTEDKLECAFRLLDPVMALISNCNGGNSFKLPHTGIRKQMRADGWDI